MAKRDQPGSFKLATFTKGELETLHRRIARSFGSTLGIAVEIAGEEYDWDRRPASYDDPFVYALRSKMASVRLEPASSSGGQSIAFSLTEADKNQDAAWVSWTEKWVKVGSGKCQLKAAGFRFFWGRAGATEQRQCVVRAEWDQTSSIRNESSTAGQPHWHVDRKIILGEAASLRQVEPKDLHLAMAGWKKQKHPPQSKFTCWQTHANCWQDLAEWAELTLEYAKDQMRRIRPAIPHGAFKQSQT